MGKYVESHESVVNTLRNLIQMQRELGNHVGAQALEGVLKSHNDFALRSTEHIRLLTERDRAAEEAISAQGRVIEELRTGACGTCGDGVPESPVQSAIENQHEPGVPPDIEQLILGMLPPHLRTGKAMYAMKHDCPPVLGLGSIEARQMREGKNAERPGLVGPWPQAKPSYEQQEQPVRPIKVLGINRAKRMMMRTDRKDLPPADQEVVSKLCAYLAEIAVEGGLSPAQQKALEGIAKLFGGYAGKKHAQLRMAYVAHGLAGEVGELVDLLKKHIYHDRPLDKTKVAEELGDIFWGWCRALEQFGLRASDVVKATDAKLWKRYPKGFNEADANARKDKV
jgi:NTP pyrophosphatase (non-canonical NTP hydrolase)